MESPHASSRVILKANINQFCIVDWPRAACSTRGVFARMDARTCLSTQTSYKYGDCCVLLGFIIWGAHMPCHSPLWYIRISCENSSNLIASFPPRYTHSDQFSLASFWWTLADMANWLGNAISEVPNLIFLLMEDWRFYRASWHMVTYWQC